MLNRRAVKDFLNRETDSWDWMKSCTEAELDKELDLLDPKPRPEIKSLWKHQKVCFLLGVHLGSFAYLLDMGTGKTRVILELIHYFKRKCGIEGAALVVAQNIPNIDNWVEQGQEHAPDLEVAPVYGSTREKELTFEEVDADVYVINYSALWTFLSKVPKAKKKGVKPKRKIDADKIECWRERFFMVVMDESTEVKSHDSIQFKILKKTTDAVDHRYILTGTPFGRDPADLWAQMYLVDRGETLGATLGLFRGAFFDTTKGYFGGYEHRFRKDLTDDLHEMLKHRSIVYDESECSEMPPYTYQKIMVDFPENMYSYYKPLVQQLSKSRGDWLEKDKTFMQMRQIASGFVGFKDDSGGKQKIEFENNPRLDALETLVAQLPVGKKMIIFNEFVWSGEQISKMLKKHKIKHVRLWSGTKDKVGSVRRFKEDPDTRIIVANSKSGAFGGNWQVANYCVFYELPVPPIIRRQAWKRAWRSGQTQRVHFFDIVLKRSVDERILQFLREGKSLHEVLLKGDDLHLD